MTLRCALPRRTPGDDLSTNLHSRRRGTFTPRHRMLTTLRALARAVRSSANAIVVGSDRSHSCRSDEIRANRRSTCPRARQKHHTSESSRSGDYRRAIARRRQGFLGLDIQSRSRKGHIDAIARSMSADGQGENKVKVAAATGEGGPPPERRRGEGRVRRRSEHRRADSAHPPLTPNEMGRGWADTRASHADSLSVGNSCRRWVLKPG